MTILKNILEKRSVDSDLARFINRGFSRSNNAVGYDTMRHSAVWACVNLIADAASTLPIDVYEKRNGVRIPVTSPKIISSPSAEVTATGWRRQVIVSWLLEGNAYGLVASRDNLLRPEQIEILDPFSVTHKYDPETGKRKWFTLGKEIPERDIIHWPGLLFPGSNIGVTPITYSSGPISTGLAAQAQAQEYFERGIKPAGILQYNGKLSPEEAQLAKQKFIASAQTAHEPVVLSGDAKYTSLNISMQDSKLLETQKASVQDIARIFRVPPEKIGSDSGSSMTYSTVEANSRAFLQDTLNPWLVRLEEVTDSLVSPPQYTKANRDAALAIDTITRYTAFEKAIRNGWYSPDDVRALEDQPPLPDGTGNVYNWPPMSVTETTGDTNV